MDEDQGKSCEAVRIYGDYGRLWAIVDVRSTIDIQHYDIPVSREQQKK